MAIRYPESEPAVHTVKHKLESTTGAGTATATESQAHGMHKTLSTEGVRKLSVFSSALVRPAIVGSFRELSPRAQAKNPMMFVVYVGSTLTTILWVMALRGQAEAPAGFIPAASAWPRFTVLFANFTEALAEGRSKQQAALLCGIKTTVQAKALADTGRRGRVEVHAATALRRDDIILIGAGNVVPDDGEVIGGVASVDESAITDESASVIRESGRDFPSVTGGMRVLSDWIVVRITTNPDGNFLDRMIPMVEDARRQKTSSELALTILLVSLTIILILATITLLPYSILPMEAMKAGLPITITVLVALLVCPIPTTTGGLLSAIGAADMSHMIQANVIATSGRVVEATGGVDVLLLDKTGTVAHGNRQVSYSVPAPGITTKRLAKAAWLSSLADKTSEGHSIITPARNLGKTSIDETALTETQPAYVAFFTQTRMNGINVGYNGEACQTHKEATDAIHTYVALLAGKLPGAMSTAVSSVVRQGDTLLVVSDNGHMLGVVELKDIAKTGIRERLIELRQIGIKTMMITGDSHLIAMSIAAEVGVDGFIIEAMPEIGLAFIREQQAQGRFVTMTDDSTSDAPALAQANIAVAMNSGTQAAKGAGSMVDLDSDPTKLIQTVEISKQMLVTCGSLITFSTANNVAKHSAIIPAAFMTMCPQPAALNVTHLAVPASAVMSVVIFNALIIVFLIPLALEGVKYRALGTATLLRRNLSICDLGGLLLPFPDIKIIDMFLTTMSWT